MAKLKKDLKKTKALLKDAHLMLDKSQNEGTNKVIMRQLKNQVGGFTAYLNLVDTLQNLIYCILLANKCNDKHNLQFIRKQMIWCLFRFLLISSKFIFCC